MNKYEIRRIRAAVAVCNDIKQRRADWDDVYYIQDKRMERQNRHYNSKNTLIEDWLLYSRRPNLLTMFMDRVFDWGILNES